MKILLLNENPVVNKLVTLSAQKTSDELEIVDNIDAISGNSYDLLVIDDTVLNEDLLSELKNKISFSKSLYICSRDAQELEGFTNIIKKPFLPTDLVELFASFGKEMSERNVEDLQSDISIDDDDISLDDELVIDDEDISLDDELAVEDEDISLDDELAIDDEDISVDDEIPAGVLDKDELQEVQDLLDDEGMDSTELDEADLDLDLDEELDLEDDDFDLDLDEELDLEESAEDISDDEVETPQEADLSTEPEEEELDLGDELLDELEEDSEEDVEFPDEDELTKEIALDEELNIEDQIQNAVGELSQEDLDSEVDEETLLDIVASDINNLDSLTARDLKLAVGEEVTEESLDESDEVAELNELEELQEVETADENSELEIQENTEITPDNNGVEALKKLLEALSNKDVAASMKGMKININITLGDD